MKWPTIEALSALVRLPEGYRFAGLERGQLPQLTAALKEWYPDISVGASSCYLRDDFYLQRVCLDGAMDKDIWGSLILSGDEMAGFWSFEREEDSLAIWGRLIVIAPAHRGAKLAERTMLGTESLGRVMGAAFIYTLVTLKNPYAQRAVERAGYRLLGLFPGRDREEVAPGVVKRVYQAAYAKLLVPEDQVHWPDRQNMTPRARELFELLFASGS